MSRAGMIVATALITAIIVLLVGKWHDQTFIDGYRQGEVVGRQEAYRSKACGGGE